MTLPRTSWTDLVIAIVVGVVGVVWVAQGLGVPIGGGFMVGDARWSIAGLCLVAVAGFIVWRRLRRSR